jgi:hypothetical protein
MSKAGVFTLQHDEHFFLPMWIKYYSKNFDYKDMYVIAHNCTELTEKTLKWAESVGINVERVYTDEIFNHEWLNDTVHNMQERMLNKYEYFVFTDCDEFIVPEHYSLREFIENASDEAYRCIGFNIISGRMRHESMFNKTLISRVPLKYANGYHTSVPEFAINNDLKLYHLHYVNYDMAWNRNLRLATKNWDADAISKNLSSQNQINLEHEFKEHFNGNIQSSIELLPSALGLLETIYPDGING